MAHVLSIGQPVNDVEREAIAFLRDHLPDDDLVVHNLELSEQGRAPHEYDIVLVGELAVYAVEVKGYYGRVSGNKRDWYVGGQHRRSPLSLTFQKARILSSYLRRARPPVGPVWVEGLVFLANPRVEADFPPDVAEHVHTQATIIQALTDPEALHRPHWPIKPASDYRGPIKRALLGGRPSQPRTHIGPYRLLGPIDQTDAFIDYEATNEALVSPDGEEGPIVRLRLYRVDPYADPAVVERQRQRGIWEASILRWLGAHPGLVSVGDPFFPQVDDVAVALPFGTTAGVTLRSYIQESGPIAPADLLDRFGPAIQALGLAHSRGVVHRRITPDAFLCERDQPFRLGDFAFSASVQNNADQLDPALLHPRYSAPEVQAGGPALPASDIFSLGVVLLEAMTGGPSFDNAATAELPPALPSDGRILEVVARMLERDPTVRLPDGYAVLEELLEQPHPREPVVITAGEVLLSDGATLNEQYRIESRLGPPRTRTTYSVHHEIAGIRRVLRVFEADAGILAAVRNAFAGLYRLRHPHLMRVDELDCVRHPPVKGPGGDPLYFVAVEFVEGPTAAETIDGGGVGAQRAASLGRSLCELLAHLKDLELHHGGIAGETIHITGGDHLLVSPPLALFPREVLSPPLLRYLDPAVPASASEDLAAAAILIWELATGRHPVAGGVRAPSAPLDLSPGQVPERERDRRRALGQVLRPVIQGDGTIDARTLAQRLATVA